MSIIMGEEEPRPSTWEKDYYIHAHAPNEQRVFSGYKREGRWRPGKWLVFVSRKDVDEVWEKIRAATEAGRLGISAKVSTAKPNPLSTNPEKHVICVYTPDWTDEADVMRVREELRRLGITGKIPYKSDEDTLKGKYAATGHRRIAKYYA